MKYRKCWLEFYIEKDTGLLIFNFKFSASSVSQGITNLIQLSSNFLFVFITIYYCVLLCPYVGIVFSLVVFMSHVFMCWWLSCLFFYSCILSSHSSFCWWFHFFMSCEIYLIFFFSKGIKSYRCWVGFLWLRLLGKLSKL